MLNPGPGPDWWRVDPTNKLSSPRLRRLLEMWNERSADGSLPTREEFQAEDLIMFGGRVVLIDLEAEPFRMRYRLIGTKITEMLGRDSTGRYLDEIYGPEYYRRQSEHFRRVATERLPLRTYGSMAHSEKPYIPAEAIDLPVGDDAGNVVMILRGLDFFD